MREIDERRLQMKMSLTIFDKLNYFKCFLPFCPNCSSTRFPKAAVMDMEKATSWDTEALRLGFNFPSIAIRQIMRQKYH